MRQTLTRIGLATTIAAAFFLLPAEPAEAHSKHRRGGAWSVGGHFAVGGIDFSIYYRPGHYDDYYYRARRQFPPNRRYRCSDRCYYRGGYNYHHASCDRARDHFRRHRFSPARVLDVVFHPYRHRGYRDHGYYDRGHRHDSSCRDRRYRRDDHYYGYRGGHYGDDSDSDSHRHRRHRY